MKKMFALSDLIDYCCGSTDCQKSLRRLSKVYKLMGRLRDHSNAMTLCLEYNIDRSIFDHEQKILKATRKKLKAKIERIEDDWGKIKRANDKRLKSITDTQCKIYLREKYGDIERVTGASPGAEELHTIRRSIRHLLCISPLCGGDNAMLKPSDADRLDRLQRDIGDWHDMVVFMDKLKALGYDSSHPKEYAALRRKEKALRRFMEKNIIS